MMYTLRVGRFSFSEASAVRDHGRRSGHLLGPGGAKFKLTRVYGERSRRTGSRRRARSLGRISYAKA